MSGAIFERIAAGDESAVGECLTRFGGLVWSFVRRYVSDPMEAEDAAQEIFVALWRNAERYDPGIASESTFVAVVARRRLIDRLRKAGKVLRCQSLDVETPISIPATRSAVELADDASQAIACLQELRPDERRVIELSVFGSLTHEEVAERSGLPLGTVKTHLRRGMQRLRTLLSRRPVPVEDVR